MKEVWIVFTSYGEDRYVDGIYDSEEKAKAEVEMKLIDFSYGGRRAWCSRYEVK